LGGGAADELLLVGLSQRERKARRPIERIEEGGRNGKKSTRGTKFIPTSFVLRNTLSFLIFTSPFLSLFSLVPSPVQRAST